MFRSSFFFFIIKGQGDAQVSFIDFHKIHFYHKVAQNVIVVEHLYSTYKNKVPVNI